MLLVQLTDLHCRPRGLPALRACETNMLTERAFRAVAAFRPRPDAVLITGDLTNNGTAEEYRSLMEMLRRTLLAEGFRVYVILGNHDCRDVARTELRELPCVVEDPTFIQYVIDDLPVRVVMLDTHAPGATHGELNARQLAWLDRTLAAAPERPTLIGMHHPPFLCGIRHMDAINLRDAPAFTSVIARHRQVRRIVCGHHHRPVTVPLAHAIASIAPGVAHQVELDLLTDQPGQWNLEPPAFDVHLWMPEEGPEGAIVSHTAYVEKYPGPFPFIADQDLAAG